jgi:hypothetical protein
MIFCLVLFVLLGLSFIGQEFLPAFQWAYQAKVFIVPMVFFSCAIAVPFPVMLGFAFFTGLIWDARHLVVLNHWQDLEYFNIPNLTFGYSIFLYGLMGALMQGIRPLFRRGRWELPMLMTGVATGLLLVLENLWLSFIRGTFAFDEATWLNIGTTALLSMATSPLLFLFIRWLSRVSGYRISYEGLKLRRSW